jgi:hypothetical protein
MLIDLIFILCNATTIFEHSRKDTAKTTVRGDMYVLLTVLRIRDILVRIRLRIRIRGSVPLTNGSGSDSGSGSWYFFAHYRTS